MLTFFEDLINILLFLPRLIFKQVIDFTLFLLNAVPVPFTEVQIQNLFSGLGGDILFFLTIFEFDFGVTVIFGALGARFILRRIPFIG